MQMHVQYVEVRDGAGKMNFRYPPPNTITHTCAHTISFKCKAVAFRNAEDAELLRADTAASLRNLREIFIPVLTHLFSITVHLKSLEPSERAFVVKVERLCATLLLVYCPQRS